MTTVNIRMAERADVPDILAIYNDAVLHTTASYDDAPVTLDTQLAWFDDKRARALPVFVATLGGRVVGWSTYGPFRLKRGYRFTVENSVYVAPDCRGQGVGARLLSPLIAFARAAGIHVMVAGVDADNVVSVRLHEKAGFRQVAHFHEVGWKFGRWLDLVFLELHLGGVDPPESALSGESGSA